MLSLLAYIVVGQQNPSGLVLPHTAKVADVVELSAPSQVQLNGLLGDRYAASEHGRLPVVDEDELLEGFRHRPGKQAWIGEHVGKWLHAASLTYLAHHDPALRMKMDRVVRGLLATQDPDGYLGTYPAGKRFSLAPDSDWDVWVHKYCIIGLLAYYQATHVPVALKSARRIGDLLVRTFRPGGKLLSQAGTHEGMASTSVLEPIVLLYRATADTRYLQFARRIVESFNEPSGSHIERDLLATHSVAKTANGKAYEMLSNLVGLSELYRATGEPRYLRPAQIAWNDIVTHRLYLTGTGSSMEHWTQDGVMPNGEGDDVGETCVTVTWIQLNLELLRLTGDSRCVDQIERSVYNHLLGSQRPDGAAWCYYSPLNGRRHPSSDTTCCLSSGPRGIALLPTFAYASRSDGVDVNLYGSSSYSGTLRLHQMGRYPFSNQTDLLGVRDGKALKKFSTDITLAVDTSPKSPRSLRLRIPSWANQASVKLGNRPVEGVSAGHYLTIRRVWHAGDRVYLHFPLPVTTVVGSGSNAGYRAFTVGPLVYAADSSAMSGSPNTARIRIGNNAPEQESDNDGLRVDGFIETSGQALQPRGLVLRPFFEAGANGSQYSVWLRSKDAPVLPESLLSYGEESQSRMGNVHGSIADGDPATFSVTFNNMLSDADWYAVVIPSPVEVSRIVFRHGQSFHDGGWFDTSSGKPQIQVLRTKGGDWETVGTLDAYPQTDGTHDPDIDSGQAFELKFPPTKIIGLRILGKPSHGDNPAQNFSSCAELEAYQK